MLCHSVEYPWKHMQPFSKPFSENGRHRSPVKGRSSQCLTQAEPMTLGLGVVGDSLDTSRAPPTLNHRDYQGTGTDVIKEGVGYVHAYSTRQQNDSDPVFLHLHNHCLSQPLVNSSVNLNVNVVAFVLLGLRGRHLQIVDKLEVRQARS